MFEFRIIDGQNIEPNVLQAAGAVFCTYWYQWVIYAHNRLEALDALNNVGICCNVEQLNK